MNDKIKPQSNNLNKSIEEELEQFFFNIYDLSGLDTGQLQRKKQTNEQRTIFVNNDSPDATDHME